MNKKLLKISTLGAYIVMVGFNYLAVLLPLNGRSTGAISDSYPNLFAPAGYAFSIWGLIYTVLAIYAVYQLWRGKDELVVSINRWFIVNALLNAFWIVTWHYNIIWLSVIIMAGLLVTLIRIADILRVSQLSNKEQWMVRMPFGVYFGWITVATIANVTVFLSSIGWNGFPFSESFWTAVILLVGALIGILRMHKDKNIAYGLVFVWAYSWILFKHVVASGFDGQYPSIIVTVAICLLLFLFFVGRIVYKK